MTLERPEGFQLLCQRELKHWQSIFFLILQEILFCNKKIAAIRMQEQNSSRHGISYHLISDQSDLSFQCWQEISNLLQNSNQVQDRVEF